MYNLEESGQFLDFLEENQINLLSEQTQTIEYLHGLITAPLNINHCSISDLEELGFLSTLEIQSFTQYRKKYGPFISIYELQSIPGISMEKILLLSNFITVKDISAQPFTEIWKQSQGFALARSTAYMPIREGYKSISGNPPKYKGSPNSLLFRFRKYIPGQFSLGFTVEKDEGEPLNPKDKLGFDSHKFHLYRDNMKGFLKTIVIGDYRVNLGQGLTQYHGFGLTKSSNPILIKRTGKVLQPFSGTSEFNFFRGIAFQINPIPKIKIWGFGHALKRDATLREDEDRGSYFSAIQTSGYHRTENEINKKNAIRETIAGTKILWSSEQWDIGFNSMFSFYNRPYLPEKRIDNFWRPTGKKFTLHSIDFSGNIKTLHIFGEIATQNFGIPAFSLSILHGISRKLDLALLIRSFPESHYPQYSNAFSSRTSPTNEHGIYLGMNYHLSVLSELSLYLDTWKSNWPTFQRTGPAIDQDLLVRWNYKKKRNYKFYIHFKHKIRNDNTLNNNDISYTTSKNHQSNLRANFEKIINQKWRFVTRIEWTRFLLGNGTLENGYTSSQDIHFKSLESPWFYSLRFCYFSTDSYESRIYSYEPDVLYSFSIPFYYFKGMRSVLKVGRKWKNGLRLELRTGWTYLTNQDVVGSGNNTINGSFSQQLKVQAMYKF
ncbi:ComEA family DNA-binding protein [Membranihabitans maritimus]|uniref:ComEA family DNA-binding protein n=1 Tax=Membranihabitans maritimus TaxID=2904244 RepID=UPI001F335A67